MMLIIIINNFWNINNSNSWSIRSFTERLLKTKNFLCKSRQGLGGDFRYAKLCMRINLGMIQMVDNKT